MHVCVAQHFCGDEGASLCMYVWPSTLVEVIGQHSGVSSLLSLLRRF